MNKKKILFKIDKERCKGCGLCIDVCPSGAISFTENVNKKGMKYIELILPEKCSGCGLCFKMCPDCAIEIRHEK